MTLCRIPDVALIAPGGLGTPAHVVHHSMQGLQERPRVYKKRHHCDCILYPLSYYCSIHQLTCIALRNITAMNCSSPLPVDEPYTDSVSSAAAILLHTSATRHFHQSLLLAKEVLHHAHLVAGPSRDGYSLVFNDASVFG